MPSVYRSWCIAPYACVAIALTLCGTASAQPQDSHLSFLEEQEGSFTFTATLDVGPNASAATAQIAFNYQNEQNHYDLALGHGHAQFHRVTDGQSVDIGAGGDLAITTGEHTLCIQRRSWRMSLVWDNRVICSAHDSALTGGNVGYAATGMEVQDAFVQLVPPLLWTDDFMRSGEASTPWEPVTGNWQQRELRTESRREADPTRSANSFCYHGRGTEGPALAVAGEAEQFWFWDNYTCTLAAQSDGGAVGVAFLYQNPDNYLLFRCGSESDPDGAALQLISVVDGVRATLAESAGSIVPGQWYALRVSISDGHIEAHLDDRLVLTAQTDLFGQGSIGLYAEGESGAYFDDVWAESWTAFFDGFAQNEPGKWTVASGSWPPPQKGAATRNGRGEALLLSGDPAWTDYVYAADVKATKKAGAGIAFGSGDVGTFVFRLAAADSGLPYAGRAQLVRTIDDQPSVIAEAPTDFESGSEHRLQASCDGSHLELAVDGQSALQVAGFPAASGRIGLYADGQGRVTFADVSVRPPGRPRAAKILPRFESPGDNTMQAWATKTGQWTPDQDSPGFWHVAGFFGDKTISFEIATVGQRTGSASITLSGDSEAPGAGYRFMVSTTNGEPMLKLALYQGSTCLQEAQAEIPARQAAQINLTHMGNHILAYVNGECILTHETKR